MKQVSKEQFFAVVGQLDVHPQPRHPEKTTWELRDRTVVGVSQPGYKNPQAPALYFLSDQFNKVSA